MTAKELNGNLILLHKVQAGPASQSHGLQVAKLAGIPISVIKEAQKRLKILEKQNITATNTSVQNDLFSEEQPSLDMPSVETVERLIEVPKQSVVEDTLTEIDIDNLTPRQALDQLYQLKALLKHSS